MRHELAAGNLESAVTMLKSETQKGYLFDRWREFESMLQLIPAERRHRSWELNMAEGWVHQARGSRQEIKAVMERARVLIEGPLAIELPVSQECALLEVALLEAFTVGPDPSVSLLDVARRAESMTRTEHRSSFLAAMFTYTHEPRLAGRLQEAVDYLEQIAAQPQQIPDGLG